MNFESRFSNQSSVNLLQNNPNLSNQSRNQPLDYFNDSKNQSKPAEKFNENSNSQPKNKNLKPSANWTFDDQQRLRDAKRDEWRKSLLEQVQEKERKKQEEKNKKMMEDKREEEKLMQERQLLEAKYKKEIQVELGLSYEEERQPKQYKMPEPKAVVKQKELPKESPMPVVKELEPVAQPKNKFRSVEFNPMKIDYWKAKSDLEIQQNSFRNILAKLKQDADQAHYERNEAMMELERFREQLRMSSIDNDLKYQQKYMFNRNYSGSISNTFKAYEPRMPEDFFASSKPLNFESKFVPLVNAGHSVINSAASPNFSMVRPDYSDLGFHEVRDQLVEIDQIISSSYE